jgi:CubicO group peptidase (beta-lactamase class C family)
MRPIGVPDDQWNIGYGRAYKVDGLDLWANWGGANFTPRAVARLAEWMMRGGQWNGKPVIERRFVSQAVQYAGMPVPERAKDPHAPGSGLCWYTNFDSIWPSVPRDAFAGHGAQQQVVFIVPSLELIIVRNGSDIALNELLKWTSIYQHLFDPIMKALGNPV